MTNILSKFLQTDWALFYNCYEVGHTWTPHCSDAAMALGSSTLREALKMYTGLYVFNLIASKKYDKQHLVQTLQSILRSSLFLGFNAFSVMSIFCGSRHLLGAFYLAVVAHLPAMIGSYLSIQLERPARRPALAFYVANIASETVYRKLVNKGLLRPLPRGEVLLFTLSMALLLYLIKRNGYGSDPVSFAIKLLIGRDNVIKRKTNQGSTQPTAELGAISSSSFLVDSKNSGHQDSEFSKGPPLSKPLSSPAVSSARSTTAATEVDGRLLSPCTAGSRGHDGHQNCQQQSSVGFCCPHSGWCSGQAAITLARNFLAGYIGHTLLTTAMRPKKLLLNPVEVLINNLTASKHFKFGAFIGLFSAIYKGSNCVLRRLSGAEHAWHGLASGLLAGPSMLFYPSATIGQYVLWKCIETVYFLGVKSGRVGNVNSTMNLVYAMSTAQLFYVAVMEPRIMRPSYMRFLNRVTDDCFTHLNRNIIDVFGTNSSHGYQPFYPDLDPKHTSNKFKESVLVWLL